MALVDLNVDANQSPPTGSQPNQRLSCPLPPAPRAAPSRLSISCLSSLQTHPVRTPSSPAPNVQKRATAGKRHHGRTAFAARVSRARLAMPPPRPAVAAGTRSPRTISLTRGLPIRLSVEMSMRVAAGGGPRAKRRSASGEARAMRGG